jgi:hypothetical protein
MSESEVVADLIEIADQMRWCSDWHCGTCAASKLRRGLEKLLDCPKSYPAYSAADMERLAHLISGLKSINGGGAAEALLLLVSRRLGFEQTSAILKGSPALSHYQLMWHAHLAIEKKRELHRQLNDTQKVAILRESKKKVRYTAHVCRIKKYREMKN